MAEFKLFAASEDTNHSFLMLLDIYPPPHLHWHLLSLTSPWCQTALCFAGHFANGWEDLLLLGAGLAAVISGSLTVRSCLLFAAMVTPMLHFLVAICGIQKHNPFLGRSGGRLPCVSGPAGDLVHRLDHPGSRIHNPVQVRGMNLLRPCQRGTCLGFAQEPCFHLAALYESLEYTTLALAAPVDACGSVAGLSSGYFELMVSVHSSVTVFRTHAVGPCRCCFSLSSSWLAVSCASIGSLPSTLTIRWVCSPRSAGETLVWRT